MPGKTKARLLDTSAVVMWLRANKKGGVPPFSLTHTTTNWIVRGEIEVGFTVGSHTDQAERQAFNYLLREVDTLNFSPASAAYYAEVFAALRRAGTLIPTNDIWIAASALEHDLELWTRDAHFDKVSSLRVHIVA